MSMNLINPMADIFGDRFREAPDPKIKCPKCSGMKIYVVEVYVMGMEEIIQMHSRLSRYGFVVCDYVPVTCEDQSTDQEVAECDDCKHRGPLDEFGFGQEDE